MHTVSEDFEAMHKLWGAGGNNPQRGVHKDNIWMDYRVVSERERIFRAAKRARASVSGQKATSGSWGVQKGKGKAGHGDKSLYVGALQS